MSNIPPSSSPFRRQQPRSLWGKLKDVVLQPVAFFRQLGQADHTRSWLWMAILILVASGVSAVRQEAALSGTADAAFSEQLVTGLLIAGRIVMGWLAQVILLALVPMLGRRAPEFGLNVRVVVWASVPFGILALVQIGYLAAGETISGAGITPVLDDIPNYDDYARSVRFVLESLATHLTLFSVWHLVLLYLGARHTLGGSWWASMICLCCWILSVVLVPALVMLLTAPPDSAAAPGRR